MGLPPVSGSGSPSPPQTGTTPPTETDGTGTQEGEQPITVGGQQRMVATAGTGTGGGNGLRGIFQPEGNPPTPPPAPPQPTTIPLITSRGGPVRVRFHPLYGLAIGASGQGYTTQHHDRNLHNVEHGHHGHHDHSRSHTHTHHHSHGHHEQTSAEVVETVTVVEETRVELVDIRQGLDNLATILEEGATGGEPADFERHPHHPHHSHHGHAHHNHHSPSTEEAIEQVETELAEIAAALQALQVDLMTDALEELESEVKTLVEETSCARAEAEAAAELTVTELAAAAAKEAAELDQLLAELREPVTEAEAQTSTGGCECGGACNCAVSRPSSPSPAPSPLPTPPQSPILAQSPEPESTLSAAGAGAPPAPSPTPEPESALSAAGAAAPPPPPPPPGPAAAAAIGRHPSFSHLRKRLPKFLCLRNLTGNLSLTFHSRGRNVELNLRRSRDFRLILLPTDVQSVIIRRPHGRTISIRTAEDHLFEVSSQTTHSHFVYSVAALRRLYTEIANEYLQAIGEPTRSPLTQRLHRAINGITADNVQARLHRIYGLMGLSTNARLWPEHNGEVSPADGAGAPRQLPEMSDSESED